MTKDAKKYPRMVHEWWKHWNNRQELKKAIADLPRVLARSRVSNIHSIDFVKAGIVASEATVVFASDEYSFFATMQSTMHDIWLRQMASSMRSDIRYTPSDCFETFPFPESDAATDRVLEALGASYHAARAAICQSRGLGLTKLYNLFHDAATQDDTPTQRQSPPFSDIRALRSLHQQIDEAVARAYGWDFPLEHGFHATAQGVRFTLSQNARNRVLDELLSLNFARHAEEVADGLHEKKAKKRA